MRLKIGIYRKNKESLITFLESKIIDRLPVLERQNCPSQSDLEFFIAEYSASSLVPVIACYRFYGEHYNQEEYAESRIQEIMKFYEITEVVE
jgi:hypothetical protein